MRKSTDGLRVRQLRALDLVSSDDLVTELIKRGFPLIIESVSRNPDDGQENLRYRYNASLRLSVVAMLCYLIAQDLHSKCCQPQRDDEGGGT